LGFRSCDFDCASVQLTAVHVVDGFLGILRQIELDVSKAAVDI
jgi:hypothetical protein